MQYTMTNRKTFTGLLFGVLATLATSAAWSQAAMECERYQVGGNEKIEWSKHRFSVSSDRRFVEYSHLSGPRWALGRTDRLPVVHSSKDGLRVVASKVDSTTPLHPMLGPVFVHDLDFASGRVGLSTFGGVVDFDPVVHDPWTVRCRRLN